MEGGKDNQWEERERNNQRRKKKEGEENTSLVHHPRQRHEIWECEGAGGKDKKGDKTGTSKKGKRYKIHKKTLIIFFFS